MIWLIPNAAMAAGAARAWVARHRIAVAAATDALDDGFASGGEPVAEVEAAAAAAEDIEGEPPTAGCPGWCAEQAGHRVACRRLVGSRHGAGAWMEVELKQLAGEQEPTARLNIYPGLAEPGLEARLTPIECAALASALAVDAGARFCSALGSALTGEAGWVAKMLARAAELAGVPACEECGRAGTGVHPEYDRDSRVVHRCGRCHSDAAAGVAR